mgnify:CR=1 FL=1
MGNIHLLRIYNKQADPSGYRVLVDRLWPRGMSKKNVRLDLWDKNIGPSNDLRKWFNHDPKKFEEFKKRYLTELKDNPDTTKFISEIKDQLKKQDVIFLFGAKDIKHNQAVILKEYVDSQIN